MLVDYDVSDDESDIAPEPSLPGTSSLPAAKLKSPAAQSRDEEKFNFFGDLSGRHSFGEDTPSTKEEPLFKPQPNVVGPAPLKAKPIITAVCRPVSSFLAGLPLPKNSAGQGNTGKRLSVPDKVQMKASSSHASEVSRILPNVAPTVDFPLSESLETAPTSPVTTPATSVEDSSFVIPTPTPISPIEPTTHLPVFIPSPEYQGTHPGYYFRMDAYGLGYYLDGVADQALHPHSDSISGEQTREIVHVAEFPMSKRRRRPGEMENVRVIDVEMPAPIVPILSEKEKVTQYSRLPDDKGPVFQPSQTQKRKHQLTYLAAKFNNDKDMLEERNSMGIRTKREVWSKYGW